ncbi:MAG: STAS domain-containing protein [Acidobacteriaceae bacterium]|nr:STAS domain-containing protein [Acidobacteriaceae bacterium]
MQTALRCEGKSCIITISGRITVDSAPALRQLLVQHLDSADSESLTVDLYEVLYVDTSCLAVLLEILREARAKKKTLCLSGLRDRPRYLVEAMRILPLFNEVAGDVPK